MTGLIEAFSVVARLETIKKKYPGGFDSGQHSYHGQNFAKLFNHQIDRKDVVDHDHLG